MADPVIESCTLKTWTKVATNVTTGTINRLQTGVKYYQTFRDTGGSAPDAMVGDTLPAEAVIMFDTDNQESVSSAAGIDVYILAISDDSRTAVNGKVRVDL